MAAGDVFRKSAADLEVGIPVTLTQAAKLEEQARNLREQSKDLIRQADELEVQAKGFKAQVLKIQEQIKDLRAQGDAADAAEQLTSN